MNSPQKKILFIHNYPAKFVIIDRDILKERYEVTEHCFSKKIFNPLKTITQVATHDIVFIWFASWYAFWPLLLARVFGKKSIVAAGGYETVNVPAINFGFQRNKLKSFMVKTNLFLAHQVIFASQFSFSESVNNVKLPVSKAKMIYHGLRASDYPYYEQKEPFVITVGKVNQEDLERKGLRLFVLAAKYLPNTKFVVIGEWQDKAIDTLRSLAGPNVHLINFIPERELFEYFKKAKVYVQASQHEAFGLSLAEAMLSGCVPVVTNLCALPEVVGDAGIYTKSTDPKDIAEAIKKALSADVEWSRKARSRIQNLFPIEKRKEAFFQLIEN